MAETNSEPKTVNFKLYRKSTQLFTIDYKDKDDLYLSFLSKIDELGIPSQTVYVFDSNGDNIQVNDADALFGVVKDAPKAKVAVLAEDDYSYSSSESMEKIHGPLGLKRRGRNHHRSDSKSRDHSCQKECFWYRWGPWGRFWCYPGFFPDYSQDFCPYYDQPPQFWPSGLCNFFPIDPRNRGYYEHTRDSECNFSQMPPFSSFRRTDCPIDPRVGHHDQMREFDFDYDQQPPFSFTKSFGFPMDPRIGHGSFCGTGRGRGGHQRGGLRGGFQGVSY